MSRLRRQAVFTWRNHGRGNDQAAAAEGADGDSRIEDGAQEYTIGNRRLIRADLKTLYDRENALQNELADIRGGGLCVTFAEKGAD